MRQLKLPAAKRFVVDVIDNEGDKVLGAVVTYQRELVDCGKAKCRRCKKGPSHGPYIYAYWSDGGRTRSLYIGKQRRSALEVLVRRRNNRKTKGSEHEQEERQVR